MLGANINTLSLVKFLILYSKNAILCKATLVLPEPAIPWTIKFLSLTFLIIAFCSAWIVLTIFFIYSLFLFDNTSCNNSSCTFNLESNTLTILESSIVNCLLLYKYPFIVPPGAS